MKNKKTSERMMEQRKRIRGRMLFLVVSVITLCGIILLEKWAQVDMERNMEWERAEQAGFPEGFPCIVVDEQGNVTGTRRGELLTKVCFDYYGNFAYTDTGKEGCYQIQADALSACKNLKILILDCAVAIDYIDTNAFRGCSQDLTVYCEKSSYVWTRLQELGIRVKEYDDNNWELLGDNTAALELLQDRADSGTLTDQELLRLYGEPFFVISESGQLLHYLCGGLDAWAWGDRGERQTYYFPTEIHSMEGIFSSNIMTGMSITIPKNVTEIGEWTFMASELGEIRFEEGSRLQTIGRNAFHEAEITELQLPEGLQVIGEQVFWNCPNLREITIPASVRSLGAGCFGFCTSLERVVILNPDISIEDGVFSMEILNPELKEDEIDRKNLDSNFITNDHLTIVCHPGSHAEKYARKYGVQVEYLE